MSNFSQMAAPALMPFDELPQMWHSRAMAAMQFMDAQKQAAKARMAAGDKTKTPKQEQIPCK